MQLTAKFALLATALVYGSSSVLALPVGSSFAAREVEAREFQDELAYAREVPESMYLDARSFFDGDYEDMDARAIPADSAPVSAAAVTPATPASAVTPETPVTADPTDAKQKALSGPEGTPGSDAAAEHPPPSKHVLGEKESGVSGATRHHHTAAERKAYRAKLTPAEREKFDEHRKATLKAKLAKMTPAEREAYEKRRKTLRKAKLAKLTPAEREKYEARRKAALKAKLAKMTPAEREAYETRHKERKEAKLAKLTPAEREAYEARRKERKEAKLGAKGATSESAATGLKKTSTEDVPAKEPSTDGTSAKPASAASPAQPASAASLPK